MSVVASTEVDEAFLQRGLTSAEVEERRAQGLVNAAPFQSSRTYTLFPCFAWEHTPRTLCVRLLEDLAMRDITKTS